MNVYQSLSQLHERESLIALAATPVGRLLVWLVATLFLLADAKVAELVSPLLALVLLFPGYRNTILAVGAIAAYFRIAADRGLDGGAPLSVGIIVVVALSYLYFRCALRYKSLPRSLQQFPLVFAHLPTLILIGFLWWRRIIGEPIPLDPLLLAVLSLLPFMMWRWSYLLFSGRRGALKESRFADHLFYLLPPFGVTNPPYGKGYDYLSGRSAKTSLDMARAQLAGLKLLFLVHLWTLVRSIIESKVYGQNGSGIGDIFGGWHLGLTPLATQLAGDAPGDVALPMAWGMVLVALFVQVLSLAIWGHLIIGCLRLFGFNVFRNTYKPLLAESVVEYWNRYYFYFKELLVEFFFYPTFLATGRLPQKARIFLSIMAAAFLGNLYYHVVRDMGLYLRSSPERVIDMLLPWFLYALMLGTGIFVSMIREKKRRRGQGRARLPLVNALARSSRIVGVWLYYGLLRVWIAGPHYITFAERFEFLLALVGIH